MVASFDPKETISIKNVYPYALYTDIPSASLHTKPSLETLNFQYIKLTTLGGSAMYSGSVGWNESPVQPGI